MAEREKLASLFRLQLRLMAGFAPASLSSRDRRRGSRKRLLINAITYFYFASVITAVVYAVIKWLLIVAINPATLTLLSYAACVITSTLVMVAKRDQMNHVTGVWIRQLEDPGCHVRTVRLLMVMAWMPQVVWVANDMSTNARRIARLPPIDLAQKIVATLGVVQSSWLSLTYTYYWMAVLIHASLERQRLALITRTCAGSSVSVQSSLASLEGIRRARVTFERLFNLFPLLWFAFNMACLPGYVSQFGHQGLLVKVMLIGRNLLPPMLLVLVVARQDERSARLASAAADVVVENPWLTWGSKLLLLRSLDAVSQSRRTGMRFFSLNKSFLVSYSGALLSFGVLLYRLLRG